MQDGALKEGTRLGVINVLKAHSCIVNCSDVTDKIFLINLQLQVDSKAALVVLVLYDREAPPPSL